MEINRSFISNMSSLHGCITARVDLSRSYPADPKLALKYIEAMLVLGWEVKYTEPKEATKLLSRITEARVDADEAGLRYTAEIATYVEGAYVIAKSDASTHVFGPYKDSELVSIIRRFLTFESVEAFRQHELYSRINM